MNPQAAFEVQSEARGPHWVAWLTRPGAPGPYRSVLVVGASREEAESRARKWAESVQAQMENSSASS
jgi:hypothetical protein